MGWVTALIAAMLVLYSFSSPVTRKQSDGTETCNRGSCWDEKSGHYMSAEEWDKKQRMLQDSDKVGPR